MYGANCPGGKAGDSGGGSLSARTRDHVQKGCKVRSNLTVGMVITRKVMLRFGMTA